MIGSRTSALTTSLAGRLILPVAVSLLLALTVAPGRAGSAQAARASGPGGAPPLYLPLVLNTFPVEQIAFESDRDGNAEIYVMNSDGSQQTGLTNNPADDYAPAWSPDGTRIAFTSSRDGGDSIYVMNADGSNPVHLGNTNTDSWPSWSPDGSHIVFQSYRDGNTELYVMNANGTGQTRLTHTAAAEQAPEYSPDGTRIVYDVVTSEFFSIMQGEIYAMNADGTNQNRLTTDPANDLYPRWSPDAARIAFFSQRSPGGIFVMQANGSNVAPLVAGDEPDWSADGRRIAFVHGTGIYVAQADGTGATLIADHTSQDFWPRWHP